MKTRRNINNITVHKMINDLSRVDWKEILNNRNATESFTVFHNILSDTLNKHAPEQTVKEKIRKFPCPWMSKGF